MSVAVKQYDIVRTSDGPLVVVLQSDLIDIVNSRVIAPLYEPHELDPPMKHLNPTLDVAGRELVLAVQFSATLDAREFEEVVGTVVGQRDLVTRATDTLIAGV